MNLRTTPTPTDLIDSSHSAKKKLGKSLVKKEAREISGEMKGNLEATSIDIMDILNENIRSDTFQRIFRTNGNESWDCVEIVEVSLNQDMSHASCRWTSPMLIDFTKFVCEKKGEAFGSALYIHSTREINSQLKKCEPRLRSILARKMSFKRVPRLLFKSSETFEEEDDSGFTDSSAIRQDFLAKPQDVNQGSPFLE